MIFLRRARRSPLPYPTRHACLLCRYEVQLVPILAFVHKHEILTRLANTLVQLQLSSQSICDQDVTKNHNLSRMSRPDQAQVAERTNSPHMMPDRRDENKHMKIICPIIGFAIILPNSIDPFSPPRILCPVILSLRKNTITFTGEFSACAYLPDLS